MNIPDTWNYPVSSFLRFLTFLYTERERNSDYCSLETVARKKEQIEETWETRELG